MGRSAALLCALPLLLARVSAGEPAAGKPAPSFSLADTEGRRRSLSDYKGKYVVLEWINHGCPFVRKHYDSGNMQALQKEFTGKGVVWLSICSSAKGKQGYYAPAEWKALAREKRMASTAILLDPAGDAGRSYGAKTTPHMYVVDPSGNLIYQGAIDDKDTADPKDVQAANNYVRQALNEAMAGKKVSVPQTRPYGCGVKYQ